MNLCYNNQVAKKSNIDPLAQMAEHMTFNHGVRSSTLRWVTKKNGVRTCSDAVLFADLYYESNSANSQNLPRTCAMVSLEYHRINAQV